jgi:ATP-dependent RNA helicase DeaD
VDRRSKLEVLTRLIDLYDFRFGIIFCSTKIMVDELDEHMHARGYAVDRLHGDITQAQRNRVMEKFRRRGFEFLIATDVAARGLDVDDLEVVFNFDLPNDAEDYTHRIGRTGRAGKEGRAFTFVSGRELYKLQGMVRFAKIKIRRENVPSLDQVEEARENVFFEKLRGTLQDGKFKRQDRIIDRLMEQGYSSTDICSALLHIIQGNAAEAAAAPAAKAAPLSAPISAERAAPVKAPSYKSEPVRRAEPARAATGEEEVRPRITKQKYERPGRTGKEPGYTTIFVNVGRKELITPADLVGKIAGVTRLPAAIVGAIDIHQRHSLVDVLTEHHELVISRLAGIRVKGETLKPALATEGNRATE